MPVVFNVQMKYALPKQNLMQQLCSHVSLGHIILKFVNKFMKRKGRKRGRVVRVPDMKSGSPGFKSRSDR